MRTGTAATPAVVEPLESRRLMSAVSLMDGVLSICGSRTAENTVHVTQDDATQTLHVSLETTNKRGVAVHVSESFDLSLVSMLVVRGGNLNDLVKIGQVGDPMSLPSRVMALGGDDTVLSGHGDDWVSGGDGNDVLDAGAGNNVVRGDDGDDYIVTASGNDRIHAGAGFDVVDAGDGDDFIRGGDDDDILDAGAGNDWVAGQHGHDSIFGGDGDDALWGNLGDDYVDGGAGNDLLGGILGFNTLVGGAGRDTFFMSDPLANSHDMNDAEDILVIARGKGKDTDNAAGV